MSKSLVEKGETILPQDVVNTKHDTSSYESNRGYKREIFDGNSLYEAFLKAKKNSDWKPQVQKFEMNYLIRLGAMQRELESMSYEFKPSTHFILNERGKTRPIQGEQIEDRIVKHALCDEVLTPALQRFLIFDNGASIKGKGINFTRRRLERHLHNFYMTHGSNEGYILLMDYSKYYDNILHSVLKEIFAKYVDDPHALWLIDKTLEHSRVDVSYMSDEEYDKCYETLFNSLEYWKIPKSELTGDRFLEKHLNIGDQVAQNAGICYPMKIDNYIKIVKRCKYYGRYMDDSYVIHEDKFFLECLRTEIIGLADELGISINLRKTRVVKLSEYWRFLQTQYSLTETGRVIKKIHPKRLTAMRRKMKSIAHLMTKVEFHNWYSSWFKAHYKIMSKLQRENMDKLYERLKEECTYVHN